MALFHAVLRLDHEHAQIIEFNGDHTESRKLKSSSHATHQHGSGVRTEHEFFGAVCDALDGIREVLVVGPQTARDDFHHYVVKHRAPVARQLAGWESIGHATDAQLLAQARKFFAGYDRMVGTPTPT